MKSGHLVKKALFLLFCISFLLAMPCFSIKASPHGQDLVFAKSMIQSPTSQSDRDASPEPREASLTAPTVSVRTYRFSVTISWNRITDAKGYILYYAPYPEADYVESIDMGQTTGIQVDLHDGAAFYVAVQAYNDIGYSDYSRIEHFRILPSHTNSLRQTFVLVPPGSFNMGSPPDEPERDADEELHLVTLTRAYYIQITEVTQTQWEQVMGDNPSFFSDCLDCPVESVSWYDIQEFIRRMNSRGEGTYRLPTEAEWEFAARANSTTRFFWGDDPACSKANYGNWWSQECKEVNPGRTMRVGSFPPNAWGIYDMAGNVWERCQDWYSEYYPEGPQIDPKGPSFGLERVDRGGGWNYYARGCRSANRAKTDPASKSAVLGFRLVWNP